jgi:putative ABC transport system ATP-binding protein
VTTVLQARSVSKSYSTPSARVCALREIDLAISEGELVVVRGRSGSGKSTLLAVLGLLCTPDSGQIMIAGRDSTALTDQEAADIRASHLGFVFQAYNLMNHLTAKENVALAVRGPRRQSERRAVAALHEVGLRERASHRPNQLSGGEQQRVAVARALINHPKILLADEPTGSLDADSERIVLDQLRTAASKGCAVIIVSHSDSVATRADRILTIDTGRLIPDGTFSSGPGGSGEVAG